MRKLTILIVGSVFWVGACTIWAKLLAQSGNNNSNVPLVTIVDNCLASDPGWAPTGGCVNKPHQGDVSFAEFNALLFSPLSVTTVGHPAWRNDPSYISIRAGQDVMVSNKGGRGHTFTEVTDYGGGFIPPLNGAGVPGKVPPLAHALGRFMRTTSGRNYILRVPGAANSVLSDAQLAGVLNWLAQTFDGDELTRSRAALFTTAEVTELRRSPMPSVLATRSAVIEDLETTGPAPPASY